MAEYCGVAWDGYMNQLLRNQTSIAQSKSPAGQNLTIQDIRAMHDVKQSGYSLYRRQNTQAQTNISVSNPICRKGVRIHCKSRLFRRVGYVDL